MWTAWRGLRDSNWRGLLRRRSLEWHLRKENNMKRQLGSFWTKWNCSDLLGAKPEIKDVCSCILNPGKVLELWWHPTADWMVKRTSWSWGWGGCLVNSDIRPGNCRSSQLVWRGEVWMRSQLSLHKYICFNENLGNLGCLQTQCGGSSASLEGTQSPKDLLGMQGFRVSPMWGTGCGLICRQDRCCGSQACAAVLCVSTAAANWE